MSFVKSGAVYTMIVSVLTHGVGPNYFTSSLNLVIIIWMDEGARWLNWSGSIWANLDERYSQTMHARTTDYNFVTLSGYEAQIHIGLTSKEFRVTVAWF